MKKFTVLIALALLAATGIGYAQNSDSRPIPAPAGSNPTAVPIANINLISQLNFGEKHMVRGTWIWPCLLTDTRMLEKNKYFNANLDTEKNPRVFSVEGCAVPADAEHVMLRITAIAVTVLPNEWGPDPGFYTVAPNSASDDVGRQVGGSKPPIVAFSSLQPTAEGGAMVELKKIPVGGFGGATQRVVEFFVERGDAHAVIEVVGYALRSNGTQAAPPSDRMAMYWAENWTSVAVYGRGDVVSSSTGVWVCTASGSPNCAKWDLVWPK